MIVAIQILNKRVLVVQTMKKALVITTDKMLEKIDVRNKENFRRKYQT